MWANRKYVASILIISLLVVSTLFMQKLSLGRVEVESSQGELKTTSNLEETLDVLSNIDGISAVKPLDSLKKTFLLQAKLRLLPSGERLRATLILPNKSLEYSVYKLTVKVLELPQNIEIMDVDVEARLARFVGYKVYSGVDPITFENKKYLILAFEAKDPENITVDIEVKYFKQGVLKIAEHADVLIITSQKLLPAAELLAGLKERENLTTKITTVEEIYSTVSGRDHQEQIRNYIKSAKENYGIKFVIILGDDDVVPARLAYIPDGAFDDNPELDGSYVETDLYYADLDYTWDDNDDDLWGDLRYDRVDGLPDVIVGRIPVSNLTEALGVVKKIERYNPVDPLYDKALLAGTDTFQIGYPEGEYLLEYVMKYLGNITKIKLYETANNLTRETFIKEMNEGSYVTLFTGHGLPDRIALTFSQSYTTGDALSQVNKILPIFVALSCDAGRFVGLDGIGEGLVINPNGGAIAFIGSTRIAWGYIGELVTQGLMGEIFWRTVKNIFNESTKYLGEVWAETVKEYILGNPITLKLAGYFINWKTIAEYNLLGDPTLMIRPEKMEEKGDLEINNGIATISSGVYSQIIINNSRVDIHNSSIVATKIVINNSTLNVSDSIIQATQIILIQSNITATNSLFDAEVETTRSIITIEKSEIKQISLDKNTMITINSSSLGLSLENIDNISGIRMGKISNLNLTSLNYNGRIVNSTVIIDITNNGTPITIKNSTINKLKLISTTATIQNSTILEATLSNSQITSDNSTLGIRIVIEDKDTNISNNIIGYNIGGSRIDGTANITSTSLEAQNSSLSINNINISELSLINTTTTIINATILRIYSQNSELTVNASRMILISGVLDCRIIESNVTTINAEGQVNVDGVRGILFHISHGNVGILNSTIYGIYIVNASIEIMNSTIIEAFANETIISFVNSKSAVIDLHGGSKIVAEEALISYWLRLYEKSQAELYNSTVWMGLTFKTGKIRIESLEVGEIDSLDKEISGYSIKVRNSTILAWDVISYGADISITDSSIGYIYAYYNTSLSIEYSRVILLRVTHNASASVSLAFLQNAYLSGSGSTNIRDTYVGTLYILGESKASLSNVEFESIVGFGNSKSNAELKNVKGGSIIPLYNTTFSIEDSKLDVYLVYTNKTVSISRAAPHYVSSWKSQDYEADGNISIKDSWVSWSIYAENSNITISSSMFWDLYLENSNASIEDVFVADMFVSYSSRTNISRSSLSGIAMFWGSESQITGSSIPTMYFVRSSMTIRDSFVIPVITLPIGNYDISVKPGYYTNANLSMFMNDTCESDIEFINTSVGGWAVIAIGQEGAVNVYVHDSFLIGLGGAVNVNITAENTYVYGYSQFIMGRGYNTTAKLVNVSTRLLLRLYRQEGVLALNSSVVSTHLLKIFDLELDNVSVREWYIESTYTDVRIIGVSVSNLIVRGANLELVSSKVDELFVRTSDNVTIRDSEVSSAVIVGVDKAVIEGTVIGTLLPIANDMRIRNSKIGLELDIAFSDLTMVDFSPANPALEYQLQVMGVTEFSNSSITSVSLSIGLGCNITIKNSQLRYLGLSGYNANVSIINSEVARLSLESAKSVILKDSNVGLDLYFEGVEATVTNVGITGAEDKMTISGVPWSLSINNSKIMLVNMTTTNAVVDLINSNITIMILNYTSRIEISHSEVLQVIGLAGDNISVVDSWVRLMNPGMGSRLISTGSDMGLVKIFMYGSNNITQENYDKIIFASQVGNQLELDKGPIDIVLYSSMTANITAVEVPVFFAMADGIAKIKLVDIVVEYPLVVEDDAVMDIMFGLEIQVLLDFSKPNKADITIKNEQTTVNLEADEGHAKIYLYQAILTSKERKDLGNYEITAKVGGFSGSTKIYLWRPTKIVLRVFGIVTYGLVILVIAIIALAFLNREKILSLLWRKKEEGAESGSLMPIN